MEATDRGLLSLDLDSDLERPDARESQRAEQASNRSRRRGSSQQLSFSIQGFRSFDTSLMSEDEIPTRDTGLELSFSNNARRSDHLQDDVPQTRSCSSPDDHEPTSGVRRRRSSSKKKRLKGKRGRGETEGSKNNNSLNYREKLECFEKGDFSGQEEYSAEDCASIPIGHRRPSTWEMDKPFELTVTPTNVDTLLISARFYNQSDVIGLCKDLLIDCDPGNCLYHKYIAEKHELVDTLPFIQDFVRANFISVVGTHSFLGLSVDQITRLLTDDGLKVRSELDVFNAVRVWIEHSRHDRMKVAGQLMGCVRFLHMPPEEIVRHVEPNVAYFAGLGGHDVLLGIYRYHALCVSQSDLTALNMDLPPPRNYVPLGVDRPKPTPKTSIKSRQGSSVSVSTHSQPHPDPNVASIPLATSSSRGRYASDGSLSRHEDAALSSQRSEGFEIPAPPPSQKPSASGSYRRSSLNIPTIFIDPPSTYRGSESTLLRSQLSLQQTPGSSQQVNQTASRTFGQRDQGFSVSQDTEPGVQSGDQYQLQQQQQQQQQEVERDNLAYSPQPQPGSEAPPSPFCGSPMRREISSSQAQLPRSGSRQLAQGSQASVVNWGRFSEQEQSLASGGGGQGPRGQSEDAGYGQTAAAFHEQDGRQTFTSRTQFTPSVNQIPVESQLQYTPSANQQTTSASQLQYTPSANQQTASASQLQYTPSANQQTASASQLQYTPSANQQTASASQLQYTPSANQQTTSASQLQYTPSANQQTASASQLQYTPSANQQTASASQLQYTPSVNQQQNASGSQLQYTPSANQRTASASRLRYTPSANQQSAAGSQLQYTPSANQQTAAGSQLQYTPSANQQTASASQLRYTSSANQQTASASQLQYTPSANQQTASASQLRYTSSANQQTASASQLQYTPSANQQTASASQLRYTSSANQQSAAGSQLQYTPSANQQTASASQLRYTSSANQQSAAGSQLQYTPSANQQNAAGSQLQYTPSANMQTATGSQVHFASAAGSKRQAVAEAAELERIKSRSSQRVAQAEKPSSTSLVEERRRSYEALTTLKNSTEAVQKASSCGHSSMQAENGSELQESAGRGDSERCYHCDCPPELKSLFCADRGQDEPERRPLGLTERQLDDIEKRIQQRREEIGKKQPVARATSYQSQTQPECHDHHHQPVFRSRTSVCVRYSRSPSPCLSPTKSPAFHQRRKMDYVLKSMSVAEAEAAEEEEEGNEDNKNASHCPGLESLLLGGQLVSAGKRSNVPTRRGPETAPHAHRTAAGDSSPVQGGSPQPRSYFRPEQSPRPSPRKPGQGRSRHVTLMQHQLLQARSQITGRQQRLDGNNRSQDRNQQAQQPWPFDKTTHSVWYPDDPRPRDKPQQVCFHHQQEPRNQQQQQARIHQDPAPRQPRSPPGRFVPGSARRLSQSPVKRAAAPPRRLSQSPLRPDPVASKRMSRSPVRPAPAAPRKMSQSPQKRAPAVCSRGMSQSPGNRRVPVAPRLAQSPPKHDPLGQQRKMPQSPSRYDPNSQRRMPQSPPIKSALAAPKRLSQSSPGGDRPGAVRRMSLSPPRPDHALAGRRLSQSPPGKRAQAAPRWMSQSPQRLTAAAQSRNDNAPNFRQSAPAEACRRPVSRNDNAPDPDGWATDEHSLDIQYEVDQAYNFMHSQENNSPLRSGLVYRYHPYDKGSNPQAAHPGLGDNMIVVTGGLNPLEPDPEIPCRLMQVYDPLNNTWSLLGKLPDARHHHGCVMLDGYLYVIGGSVVDPGDLANMALATNSCYRYDFGSNFWTAIAPMRSARMYHSVAVLEGVIYAMGGESSVSMATEDHCFLDSCEYYNPDLDEWGPIAKMLDENIGAAIIGFRGLLWMVGGYLEIGEDNVVLASVECYDPRTNSWTMKNPLPQPVCHACIVEVHDTLLLLGGSNVLNWGEPVESLPSVLRYAEDGDYWVLYQTLVVPRHDADCCVLGSRVYVLGGVSSVVKNVLDSVECLDVEMGDWLFDTEPLPYPALGLRCVAIGPADFE